MRPLRKLYGSETVVKLGPLKLKAVRQEFIRAGHYRSEINKRVRRIVRMFKWGVGEELIPAPVHQSLKAVEGLRKGRGDVRESKPISPVPDAYVDAVRPFVSRQVSAMIELQRLTGMRPGEVCMMRTGDINTAGRIWEYVPMEHKTEHHDKDRTIFIGPQAQQVLKPWLRTELQAFLFQPREAEAERRQAQRAARKSKVQPSQQDRRKIRPRKGPGECYDPDSYRRATYSACDRAFPHPTLEGIPKDRLTAEQAGELKVWRKTHRWHPHQLRHNAATRLRREFGLDAARAVLGHSTPVVTEIYAELDRLKAAEVMGKIG